jgi:hypothetical protein
MQPFESNAEHELARALRELPLASPDAGGWARLDAALKGQRAQARTRWWPQAAAAAIVAIALVPLAQYWRQPQVPQTRTATTQATAPANDVISRNQALELTLNADVNRNLPQDGAAALVSAQLEDLIGMLDLELSASHDSAESQDLWQQRLLLMQQLASVRERGLLGVAANDSVGSFADAGLRID